jgi:16S rRNA (cytidine1402-2'-O)-methyltransferase
MPASLYVVATPIGNLEDITLRALSTLKSVALVAAEDTRRTAILLRHFGISTPATSFHEHNERERLPQLLQALAAGRDVALVSDAGTPVVADPGQRLIAAAIAQGTRVVPIPGPSAVLAALAVSGLPADDFVFAGFAPAKSNDRIKWLRTLGGEKRPIVFFEAPHRIRKMLEAMSSILVERPIIICRELTKLHEEVIRTSTRHLSALPLTVKGEFTIVIGAESDVSKASEVVDDKSIYSYFYHLTKISGSERRAAITQTAQYFGLSTKLIYKAVERLKNSSTP